MFPRGPLLLPPSDNMRPFFPGYLPEVLEVISRSRLYGRLSAVRHAISKPVCSLLASMLSTPSTH